MNEGIKTLGGLMTLAWIALWFASIWVGFFFGLVAGLAVFFSGVWAFIVALLCAKVAEDEDAIKVLSK